jgi:excisionase family DNA binding protein
VQEFSPSATRTQLSPPYGSVTAFLDRRANAVHDISACGLTVTEVARRFRVSADKVRTWIKRGELRAVNTADRRCRRPRFIVPVEALSDFERRRAAATPEAPKPPRRKRTNAVDFYPD